MDPMAAAGMIFSLIVLAMIGGFILLYPVSRHLSKYLEDRLSGGVAKPDPALREELRRLGTTVEALQVEVERLAERQDFTDSLLTSGEQKSLGAR